ncbi:MAG: hypothetical protein IKF07_01040 [Eubacterium sp.]|nr:hypothetical protein [Eubacterium sp.]
MLFLRILTDPIAFVVYWVVMTIGYFFVLKKMPLKRWTCIVPFLAEREMTKVLFRTMRSFYRPFIISLVFGAAALYLGTSEGMGLAFAIIVYIVYGIFLCRLHWRLAKSFGKGVLFRLGTIILPPIFMAILGISKAEYTPLKLRPVKELPPVLNFLAKAAIVLLSGAEIIALVVIVGTITIQAHRPGFLVEMDLEDIHDELNEIESTEEVVSREEAMGEDAALIDTMETSRDKFFPNHSQDKSVVVLTYIVGSNLEDMAGLASANIRQMIDATGKGDALKFIVQAGGSKRWFTSGIDDESYGRYEIQGGELSKVEDLPDDMSMADEESLEDFLLWAKDKYQADRYMLVLWDHGGGVAMGFGSDDLNKKHGDEDEECMDTPEVIQAVKKSGIKFDVIGFDACLMQDIEVAAKMEPYTDYYLASEEVEGGLGWYYTSPFGKLAKDPGMSTEEFAVDMLSCYDQLNTIVKDDDGKPDTKATLSLVDTTLAKPAYDEFVELLELADRKLKNDPGVFADMAVAGSNAYNFDQSLQIDLIDYLTVLKKADYEDDLTTDEELDKLINRLQACVLYRNKNSANGINGMAFAFPYKTAFLYSDTSKALKDMKLNKERKVFNDIFSIIAVQKKKAAEQDDYMEKMMENAAESDDPLSALMNDLAVEDLTVQEWYVKGFEDYDDTEALVDIPLTESADGYKIELPEQAWNIIVDCETMVWQKTEKTGEMRYLGKDQIVGSDENGNPTVVADDYWVHIDGQPVCYEAEPVRETEDGDVYSGKVRARLNDEQDIILLIEWDPVKDGSKKDADNGRITGYYPVGTGLISSIMNVRGTENLKTGDTLQFIFDICDEEGNIKKTAPAGKTVRVIKQGDVKVEDAPLGECDIVFNGLLTDIYQRTMTTEQLEMHVGE